MNNKLNILNCSELINYINNSKDIKTLCLFNFPLENLIQFQNAFIEYIFISNFFNIDNGIKIPINKINLKMPKLSKIKIKIKDFDNLKEFTYMKRNNTNINNFTLNLYDNNIEIDNLEIINLNMTIIPKKIFSIINSFEGINIFKFSFAKIIKYENSEDKDKIEQFDLILNENLLFE